MGYLWIAIGLYQLHLDRASWRARTLCAGLVLVGIGQLAEAGTGVHEGLTWAAAPVLVVGLVLAYRDGTLQRTYLCWRRRAGRDRPGLAAPTPPHGPAGPA